MQNTLTVSIVIPAYNEEILLPHTLNSLKNQDYKKPFEIIICDNNSTDRTGKLAKEMGATLVVELKKGSSYAYDTGMRHAKGDLILVTNADTLLPPNWISSIVKAYENDNEVVAVGTKVKFFNAPKWVNRAMFGLDSLNPVKGMWGVSMSCRKWAFYKVGGFAEGINTNEDALFTLKLKKLGKLKILNDVTVEMDGRRFNGGLVNAYKAWKEGIGGNSLSILFNYIFRNKIQGTVTDFKDIREEQK